MRHYCIIHDSYYDLYGEWIEKPCRDELCGFCPQRPKKHRKNCRCLNELNSEKVASLGLDPETIEGDYRESFQIYTHFFNEKRVISKEEVLKYWPEKKEKDDQR